MFIKIYVVEQLKVLTEKINNKTLHRGLSSSIVIKYQSDACLLLVLVLLEKTEAQLHNFLLKLPLSICLKTP